MKLIAVGAGHFIIQNSMLAGLSPSCLLEHEAMAETCNDCHLARDGLKQIELSGWYSVLASMVTGVGSELVSRSESDRLTNIQLVSTPQSECGAGVTQYSPSVTLASHGLNYLFICTLGSS